MRCTFCGDPAAHPASGAMYSPRVLACHACVVGFWSWFRRQMSKRWGGADFYAAAARWVPAPGVAPGSAASKAASLLQHTGG